MIDRLGTLLRDYPLVAGFSFALLLAAVLLSGLGVLMQRGGYSLKPLVWFGVLFTIIALPQAMLHLADALAFAREARMPSPTSTAATTSRTAPAPQPWRSLLGAETDPALITDPRAPLAPLLDAAEDARMAFSADAGGSSVLVARFADHERALDAFEAYGRQFGLPGLRRDDAAGYTGQRFARTDGDWLHVLVAGSELYAWSAPTQARALERRIALFGAPIATATNVTKSRKAHQLRLVTGRLPVSTMLMIGSAMLIATVLWFFWGLAWAARLAPANVHGAPASVAELRAALLRLEAPGLQIRPGADGSITLDWTADARWLDLMRANQRRLTERYVLQFDETRHRVRVREFFSRVDAAAGLDGLRLDWHTGTGIRLFHFEQSTVAGVQLDAQGRPTGALSHTLTLDAQALKRPAIDTVLRAGWSWQPVLIDRAPDWLRGLTG